MLGDAFGQMEGVVLPLENAATANIVARKDNALQQIRFDAEDGTYIFPEIVSYGGSGDGLPGVMWRPSPNGEPQEMSITYPEVCSVNATSSINATNKMPGYGSKKVALVFRGDSFRGLSYATEFDQGGKFPFYCTDKAAAIQKALAASHLKFIVEPIEAAGYQVSIYLSGYGCTGLPHVDETLAHKRWKELKQWCVCARVIH